MMYPADVPLHRASVGATHICTASQTAADPFRGYVYRGTDHGMEANVRIVNRRMVPSLTMRRSDPPKPAPRFFNQREVARRRAKRKRLLLAYQAEHWPERGRDHGPTRAGWEEWKREQREREQWEEQENARRRAAQARRIAKREKAIAKQQERDLVSRNRRARSLAPAPGWSPLTGADIEAALAEL